MATTAFAQTSYTSREKFVMGLETVMGLSGVGGGAYLISQPTTAMPLEYLKNTPFPDWTGPGIFLLCLVGIAPFLAIALQIVKSRFASLAHAAIGTGMVAWVVLEAAWIVWNPALQAPFFVLGLVIFGLQFTKEKVR